jgi:hypothetical protein
MVSDLSDVTNRFKSYCGLANDSGDPTSESVTFNYVDNENGGKILCVCRNNNSETTADSGVTVVAGAWYKCEFVVNAGGTSVAFYINGTLVATITTNIPTGTSRALMARLRHSRSSDNGAGRSTYVLFPSIFYFK